MNIHPLNGHLVRENNTAGVYFVIGGKALPIENPSAFNSIFTLDAWNHISSLTTAEMAALPKGAVIKNPQLLSIPDTGAVCLATDIDDDPLDCHWIISVDVFNACHFNWGSITYPDDSAYKFGENIVYGAPADQQYITDIKLGSDKNEYISKGYTVVDFNLRSGTSFNPLYIFYKKGFGSRITDLCILRGDLGSLDFVKSGSDTTVIGEKLQIVDTYLYLAYKKQSRAAALGITDILVYAGGDPAVPEGYAKLSPALYNWKPDDQQITICYRRTPEEALPATCNWMSYISDNKKICDLSIPGAHDCAMWWDNITDSGVSAPFAWCQYYDITTQFNLGVRAFDLRI